MLIGSEWVVVLAYRSFVNQGIPASLCRSGGAWESMGNPASTTGFPIYKTYPRLDLVPAQGSVASIRMGGSVEPLFHQAGCLARCPPLRPFFLIAQVNHRHQSGQATGNHTAGHYLNFSRMGWHNYAASFMRRPPSALHNSAVPLLASLLVVSCVP